MEKQYFRLGDLMRLAESGLRDTDYDYNSIVCIEVVVDGYCEMQNIRSSLWMDWTKFRRALVNSSDRESGHDVAVLIASISNATYTDLRKHTVAPLVMHLKPLGRKSIE